MVKFFQLAVVTAALASAVAAANEATVQVGTPTDHACYRRTHLAANKKCAQGFEFDNALTCWAECPLEYPVECGMECIPQNKDCAVEVIDKVKAVASAALKTASLCVPQIGVAAKGVELGIRCGQQLFTILEETMSYTQELEAQFPNTTKDQLLSLAMHGDIATVDLPLAVTTCLNLPVPENMEAIGKEVTKIVQVAIQQLFGLSSSSSKPSLSTASFSNVTQTMFAGSSAASLLPTASKDIQDLLDSGTTCGKNLKSAITQMIALAKEVQSQGSPDAAALIRIAFDASPIVLQDLPTAIKSCGDSVTDIRKFVDTIMTAVSEAAVSNGKAVDKTTFALAIADMALDAISHFDPTGIAAMVAEFVEPICDPTILVGEIDDGSASSSLDLQTMGKAFVGSSGEWKNAGDGMVSIAFQSADSKDVTVNIKSGGDVIAKVPVKHGQSTTWTKSLADLQDKTLYMDRWRPGLLGIPGTGGGSLLLWVPHPTSADGTSTGGHLDLKVMLQVS